MWSCTHGKSDLLPHAINCHSPLRQAQGIADSINDDGCFSDWCEKWLEANVVNSWGSVDEQDWHEFCEGEKVEWKR